MKQKYKHVIVVGVDGAGAFFKDADTPYFDRIFEKGAVTYRALASFPSGSAQCWGSMLLGVGPEVHGLTNERVEKHYYPADSQFPSVFRRIREAMPDAELAVFSDWPSIPHGIVEQNIDTLLMTGKRDTKMTPIICKYVQEKKPSFLFVQMDSPDGIGHRYGYGTEKHLIRIHEVDKLINDIFSAIQDARIKDDTLFMVICDHGGINDENGNGSHGGWSDSEKYVTFAITGKNVRNTEIKEMNVRDLAAIVLYALGIEVPQFDEKGWTAQVPEGIWNDKSIPEYQSVSPLADAIATISKQHG